MVTIKRVLTVLILLVPIHVSVRNVDNVLTAFKPIGLNHKIVVTAVATSPNPGRAA